VISLTWAVLQERITTTPYGHTGERFRYSIFLNTVQSTFAAVAGYIYLRLSSRNSTAIPAVFPNRGILFPLILIAITQSLASPFGYASLAHIDYITYILAKSCKLLPVIILHVGFFRKKYPFYKYAVVALVTLGVAIFSLHNPSTAKKAAKKSSELSGRAGWGLFLLGINLLFDGITNSTQDYIFQSFRPYSGPQMMVAQNVMSTILTVLYLLLSPYISKTAVGAWLGMPVNGGELNSALAFIGKYPTVGWDVLGFSACGAVGQVFICKSAFSNTQRPKFNKGFADDASKQTIL
jgi:solute carrier family 35 (UDP-galactose transporter), member B1